MAGNVWGGSLGEGFLSSHQLSKKLRMALKPMMKFRQFADTKDASQQGLHKGGTYTYNVYQNVGTAGAVGGINAHDTTSVGAISGIASTANLMPETDFETVQGSVTLREFGNSVPYSEALDNMSEVPVTEIINKVLKFDAAKTLDGACFAEFNKAPLTICSDGGVYKETTTGLVTAGSVNDAALDKADIIYIIDKMSERNIPGFAGDSFYSIAHPTTLTNLKGELETVHQYTIEGLGMIKQGEIGKYRNMKFVEQTNIAKNYDATTDFSVAGASNWAFFFGADTVAEAVAIPEEMRGRIPGDFGRKKGVAWYANLGYGLVHTYAMRPSGTTDNPDARIMKWASAAV
jgi:N4-gp56 family major capsid protein